MSVSVRTLDDAQREISQLRNQLDTLLSKNINLSGRRIMNAGRSEHPHDLVRRDELTGENLASEIVQNIIVNTQAAALPGNLAYVDRDNNFSTIQTFLRNIIFSGTGFRSIIGHRGINLETGSIVEVILQSTAGDNAANSLLLRNTSGNDRVKAGVSNSGANGSVAVFNATGNTITMFATGVAGTEGFYVGVNRVIGARLTGWGAPTGTATRTTFATGTVTLVQLAERVKALIDDLTTHGVIGA